MHFNFTLKLSIDAETLKAAIAQKETSAEQIKENPTNAFLSSPTLYDAYICCLDYQDLEDALTNITFSEDELTQALKNETTSDQCEESSQENEG
jgi:hypothetical protein